MEHLVTSIKRYSKIYWILVKFAAMWETEYRGSFILEIFVEVAYFIATLIGIRVLFWNIQEIAGWNLNQMLVLMGINQIFSELVLGLAFIMNLRDLPRKVTSGDLDLLLTKPINSQFAVSFSRPYFALAPSCIAGLIIVYTGFRSGNIPFNALMIFPFLVIFICGLIVAYSIGMIITTLSFWFINATPLPNLAEKILFMAKNPFSVFGSFWRIVFLVVIPLAFMVSFPSQVLLGEVKLWWLPASLVLAAVFLYASNIFWNFALKRYSSASS